MMNRLAIVMWLTLSTVVVCMLAVASSAQNTVVQPPFSEPPNHFLFKWDVTQSVLGFYRDVKTSIPAIETYSETGTPSPPISPLADFPKDEELYVWDIAATPEAGTAISAMFKERGTRKLWYRLLFYDGTGTLAKVWNMYPYEHDRIVVDSDGNVYAFGDRVDITSPKGNPDYPVLIKYSPDGKISKELLQRSDFPLDKEFVHTGGDSDPFLYLAQDTLVLYVSGTGDLFSFDLDGKLQRRTNLYPVLSKITSEIGASESEVMALVGSDRRGFIAQIRSYIKKPTGGSFSFSLVKITSDGSSWARIGPTTNDPQPGVLLGSGRTAMMFLNHVDGKITLIQWEVPLIN
jgi:hypothetical protein